MRVQIRKGCLPEWTIGRPPDLRWPWLEGLAICQLAEGVGCDEPASPRRGCVSRVAFVGVPGEDGFAPTSALRGC
jgi:hypothetical protein